MKVTRYLSALTFFSLLSLGCGSSTSEETQSDTIEADAIEADAIEDRVERNDAEGVADVSPEAKEDVLPRDEADTPTQEENADVSPLEEVDSPGDVGLIDTAQDTGVVESADTASEDTASEDTASEDIASEDAFGEDSSLVSDASSEEVMNADTPQPSDGESTEEISEGDEGDIQDDTQEATEDISEVDESPTCDPEGTWVLETTSAALPGEGCQPDGSPAQGPNTKTFIVTQNPDGSLTGVVPELTEPIPEVSVTKLEGLPCSFEFTLAVSIYFPSLGGEEPSTVYLTYTYTVDLADGGVHGSGTVHSATIFESGEIQTECTEAITIGGGFTPLGG